MPTFHIQNRFAKIAALIWLLAIIQSSLAIIGIFTITQSQYERIAFGVFELITMSLVIIYSVAILRSIAKQKCTLAETVSKACVGSLLLCFVGDVINRNFMQQFYQYDEIVKHSYLADSVLFFFPGYLLIIATVAFVAYNQGVTKTFMAITALLASVIALVTYQDMHIANSSLTLTVITMSYSVLVSILAVSALWLLKAFAWSKAPLGIWLAAGGLVLAMVADAIIGQFWIFGNQGQGFFPVVSHSNWIVYIGSQLLIQQLPLSLVRLKKEHA